MSTGFQAGRSSGEEILKIHFNHMNSLLSLSKQWPRFQPWCKWRTKPWWGTRVQSGRTGWLRWWLPWWQRRVWLQPRFIIWWRPRLQPWCKWRTKPWWGTGVQSGRTGWLPWWWLSWWQRRVWLQPRFIIWRRPKWSQHSGLCHLGAENRRPGEGEDHVGGAEKVLPLLVVDLVPEQVRGTVRPIAALPM